MLEKTLAMALANGFSVIGLDYSPIKGGEGNIEFITHLQKSNMPLIAPEIDITAVVTAAHEQLKQ